MRRDAVAAAIAWAAFFCAGSAEAQVSYGQPPSYGQRVGYGQPVRGQPMSYGQPARSGGLGGGFIELLMTGRAPSRQAGPADPFADPRSQAARRGQPAAPSGWADPFAEPPPGQARGRFASISSDPDLAPIAAAPAAQFRRQEVPYGGSEAPGTLVVDTPSKFLYHVLPGGRAMRYGIGVGRPGFTWAGIKSVTMKKEWPDWRPPPEMLKRRPDLPRFMEGGPDNPLGARALYLGSSLYRIHGTNEPNTIGRNVSSGCIRMMNEDVIHLYNQVGVGTQVKVI